MNQPQRRILVWSFFTLSVSCFAWLAYLKFFYLRNRAEWASLLSGDFPFIHWTFLLGVSALILGLYIKAGE